MTRVILQTALPLAAALFVSGPAAAMSDSDGRAVAACRAEMLSRFAPDQVRSHRIGAIEGNSRNTRVTIHVNADRRYTLQCAAGRDGRLVTASWSPSLDTRLAARAEANPR